MHTLVSLHGYMPCGSDIIRVIFELFKIICASSIAHCIGHFLPCRHRPMPLRSRFSATRRDFLALLTIKLLLAYNDSCFSESVLQIDSLKRLLHCDIFLGEG